MAIPFYYNPATNEFESTIESLGTRFGLEEIFTARETLSPTNSHTQVASNELNIPAHMQHQLEGGQLTPNEFYEWQSIPQSQRPLTGAAGGRAQLKPGGIVEPGVTHYGGYGPNLRWKDKSNMYEVQFGRPGQDNYIYKTFSKDEFKKAKAFRDKSAKIYKDTRTKEFRVTEVTDRPWLRKPKLTGKAADVREVLSNFIKEGKTSFSNPEVLEALPKNYLKENFDGDYTQFRKKVDVVKKEKAFKKLKFVEARPLRFLEAEQIKNVITLIEEGKDIQQIETATGVSRTTIYNTAKENKLKLVRTPYDKRQNIIDITKDINKLGKDNRILNAFKKGEITEELLETVGKVLKSDDMWYNSRRLFDLAEYYDGSLAEHYKVKLPKPTKHQVEGSIKIIASARDKKFVGNYTGYAFDSALYKYGAKKVDKVFNLPIGTFKKLQLDIAKSIPETMDELFSVKSGGRLGTAAESIFVQNLTKQENLAKMGLDSAKSKYEEGLINIAKDKSIGLTERNRLQTELLKKYHETLAPYKKKYRNIEFADFEIGKHPSKTIKNWNELGSEVKKQLVANYNKYNISPKTTKKVKTIFQIAEEVGSKTWKNLSPEIRKLLQNLPSKEIEKIGEVIGCGRKKAKAEGGRIGFGAGTGSMLACIDAKFEKDPKGFFRATTGIVSKGLDKLWKYASPFFLPAVQIGTGRLEAFKDPTDPQMWWDIMLASDAVKRWGLDKVQLSQLKNASWLKKADIIGKLLLKFPGDKILTQAAKVAKPLIVATEAISAAKGVKNELDLVKEYALKNNIPYEKARKAYYTSSAALEPRWEGDRSFRAYVFPKIIGGTTWLAETLNARKDVEIQNMGTEIFKYIKENKPEPVEEEVTEKVTPHGTGPENWALNMKAQMKEKEPPKYVAVDSYSMGGIASLIK